MQKTWPRVTKPIMLGRRPCKLLCAFEVKVSNWLGLNFLALADIFTDFLILERLVAVSSWPCTFLYPLAYHYMLSTNDAILLYSYIIAANLTICVILYRLQRKSHIKKTRILPFGVAIIFLVYH